MKASFALFLLFTAAEMKASSDVLFSDGLEAQPAPIAIAGPNRDISVLDPQVLDASQSSSAGTGQLSYHWALRTRPGDSIAELRDAHTAFPALVPDKSGTYWVELVVNNGVRNSAPDTARIRAFENFGIDSDGDTLSDSLERSLGLDPYSADSFGDGIRDADRDLDNDGLTIRQELLLGLDPVNADTDGNGIRDGEEDIDNDGLSSMDELGLLPPTNPINPDTDGDGWIDGYERDADGDPLNPNIVPRLFVTAEPMPTSLQWRLVDNAEGIPFNIASAVASGHRASRPLSDGLGGLPPNTVIAPQGSGHHVQRTLSDTPGGLPLNTVVALPGVGHSVLLPTSDNVSGVLASPIVGPPITGHAVQRNGTEHQESRAQTASTTAPFPPLDPEPQE